MIHVLAFITAKPGQRAAVLEIFQTIVATVVEEDGCIEYNAAIDAPGADPAFGEDTFAIVEKWESARALAAHGASPHMAAFRDAITPLVAKLAIHVLDPA